MIYVIKLDTVLRWLMQQHHIDPEEALKVHEDVKATRSIGIHWGTFNMSAEVMHSAALN